MDTITDLSIKIAEAAVPDEIDLAPLMTEAFILGGKEKESLFVTQEGAGLGAFGLTEGTLLFPWILKGIAVTAPFMPQFLHIDQHYLPDVYYFLGVIHFLGIFDKLNSKKEATKLPESYQKLITNLYEKFSSELKESSIPEEERKKIIENVLITLIKNPFASLELVEKLAKSK
jgi:hypothetical protein